MAGGTPDNVELELSFDPVQADPSVDGGITYRDDVDGGSFQMRDAAGVFNPRGGGGGTDELVKVDAADTTAGYLEDKLEAVAPVEITEVDTAGNKRLQVTSVYGQDAAFDSDAAETAGGGWTDVVAVPLPAKGSPGTPFVYEVDFHAVGSSDGYGRWRVRFTSGGGGNIVGPHNFKPTDSDEDQRQIGGTIYVEQTGTARTLTLQIREGDNPTSVEDAFMGVRRFL